MILEIYEPAELQFCHCGLSAAKHRMDTVMQKPIFPGSGCSGFRLVRDGNPWPASDSEDLDRKIETIQMQDDSYTRVDW